MPKYTYTKQVNAEDIAAALGVDAGTFTVYQSGDTLAVEVAIPLSDERKAALTDLLRQYRYLGQS